MFPRVPKYEVPPMSFEADCVGISYVNQVNLKVSKLLMNDHIAIHEHIAHE